jgi:hypothetical protein
LLELYVFAVFGDTVFDSVLNVEWIAGISWIARSDWHDPCGCRGEHLELFEKLEGETLNQRWCLGLRDIERRLLDYILRVQ